MNSNFFIKNPQLMGDFQFFNFRRISLSVSQQVNFIEYTYFACLTNKPDACSTFLNTKSAFFRRFWVIVTFEKG